MNTKKKPERRCISCNEKKEKHELLRIVRTPEQNVIIDETGKANGRGAYLKKDLEVIEKAKKSKALEKALNVEIPNEIFDELKELIK